MKICKRCGREYSSQSQNCSHCNTELTHLRELDSFSNYLGLRNQSNETDASDEEPPDQYRLPTLVTYILARILSLTVIRFIIYMISIVIIIYGLIGISAGYWFGGVIVIASSAFLTPPLRRKVGSDIVSVAIFLVLFILGRSSPLAWVS